MVKCWEKAFRRSNSEIRIEKRKKTRTKTFVKFFALDANAKKNKRKVVAKLFAFVVTRKRNNAGDKLKKLTEIIVLVIISLMQTLYYNPRDL